MKAERRSSASVVPIVGVLALALGLVAVTVAHANDPDAAEMTVDLSDRVPARWLSDDADALPIQSPRLLRRLPRRCHTRGGYRDHCQGPRRVPEATGESAARATRLSLGLRASALLLRHGAAAPEWLAVAAGTDSEEQLTFPVPGGRIGRGFGRTRGAELASRPHYGVDIGAEEGTPVLAARGGLVVYSDNGLTGYGNVVMLLHEDDSTTFYAHCRETLVAAGQAVARGQQIASVGSTGFADRPHLHWEYRIRGWARDPVVRSDRATPEQRRRVRR
ncbi:MAG: M23 family metallopeptidase [Deltaproteobacteria bacterium]|nr:M23 family metallopeptidase [Deltaproteobacteria bacterium]